MKAYRTSVALLATLFVAVGIAMIARTAAAGGGIGYVLGALFAAAGAARLTLLRRRGR